MGEGPQRLQEKRAIEVEKRTREAEKNEQEKRDCLTFGEFFEKTYFPKAKEDKRPTTWKTERGYFTHWIKPVIGDRPLVHVSIIDLEKIKRNMNKAGRSPKTISDCLGMIRHVFNYAGKHGKFEGKNPVSQINFPKRDNKRVRYLTREEAQKLLSTIKGRSLKLHDICLLSLQCGLRAGEIFNLTWGDVDFEHGQLFIKESKSGKNRFAFLTSEASDMLSDRYHGQRNQDLVFVSSRGKKITSLSNLFEKVVKELDFNDGVIDQRKKVVFHTLRHTYASWLVEKGVDLYTVSKLLGHSNILMTQRYSHLGENSLRAAVARLEEPYKAETIDLGHSKITNRA